MDVLRIKPIRGLTISMEGDAAEGISLACLDGRAKWVPASGVLSVKLEMNANEPADDRFFDFIRTTQDFRLAIAADTGKTEFRVSTLKTAECHRATLRPGSPLVITWQLKFLAATDS